MSIIIFDAKCPRCNRTDFWRERRLWWMRLMVGSKYLRCMGCDEKIVSIRPVKMLIFVIGLALLIMLAANIYKG